MTVRSSRLSYVRDMPDLAPIFDVSLRICEEYADLCDKEIALDARKRAPPLEIDSLCDPDEYIEEDAFDGDAVIAKIRRSLDMFGIRRSHDQRNFHEKMIRAVMPLVYGDAWNTQKDVIMARHGFDKVKAEVIISCPRRWGKTWSVAMFVAALLYSLPGDRIIAIFSTTLRQASFMMSFVYSFFMRLPGAPTMFIRKNLENMYVSPRSRKDDPCVNHLLCLPSNSVGSRGTTAHVIILEEAAFIPEDMFFDVVVPLIGVNQTAVIGISTPPLDGFNYYLQLFEVKDDFGEPLFEVINVERICGLCKEDGKTDCPHLKSELPTWKSLEREERTRKIYERANPEKFKREVLGIAVSDDINVFNHKSVAALYARPAVSFRRSPKFMFTAVDPAGGGTASDTAWVSLAYFDDDSCAVSDCVLPSAL